MENFAKMEFSAVLTDMSLRRSKKRGNIFKANTICDATKKFFM